MSLKAFHVLFVVVSTVLAIGFGAWAIGDYRRSGEVSSLVVGVVSLSAALGLVVYGRWFWKKLRGVGCV